jgi:hypothetical protein
VSAILLINLSVVTLYRRIFGLTWSRYLCAFLTIGYFIVCTIALVPCCWPPSYRWTQEADANSSSGGGCVFDLYSFYIGNTAVNVSVDILIICVPAPFHGAGGVG